MKVKYSFHAGGRIAACVLAAALMSAPAIAQTLDTLSGQNPLISRTGTFTTVTCVNLTTLGVNPMGTTAESDLLVTSCGLVGAVGTQSDATLNQTLEGIAHDEISAFTAVATQTVTANIQAINKRLYALRDENAPNISLAGLSFRDSEGNLIRGDDLERALREHSAAGDGVGDSKLGVFLNGLGGLGNFSGTDEEKGFDWDTWGVVAGADYRLTDQLALGGSFGWSSTNNDFDNNAGSLDDDTYTFSAYGTYQLDAAYFDGVFSYSRVNYDMKRKIPLATGGRTADSSTDSNEYGGSLGAGYNFTNGGLSWGPLFRMSYLHASIDGYSESGAGGLNLRVQDQDFDSFTTDLGLQGSYAISTGFGVVTPYLRGEWEHQYENQGQTVTATFRADPTGLTNFVRTSDGDDNYFNLTTGVSATFAQNISAFFNFDTLLGYEDVEAYLFTVGARMEF